MKNKKKASSGKNEQQDRPDQRLDAMQTRIIRLEEKLLEKKQQVVPPPSPLPSPSSPPRVVGVDRIFKYPRTFSIGLTTGLTSLTLGHLINQKVREGVVTLADLQEKLGLSPEDFERLQKDQLMPTEEIIKNLLAPLQVSYSDINVCRAHTIRKIKNIHFLSKETIEAMRARWQERKLRVYLGERNSATSIIKPFERASFCEVLNHFRQNSHLFVLGFTANLFLRNLRGNIESGNPLDYERKDAGEIQTILELRKTPRIVVLEYPSKLIPSPNPCLKSLYIPQFLIGDARHHLVPFFARLKINGETKFCNTTSVRIGSDWQLKIEYDGKTEDILLDDFLGKWKETAFEGIVVAQNNIFPRFLAAFINDMVEKPPEVTFLSQYLHMEAMRAPTRKTEDSPSLFEQGAFMSVIPAVYPVFLSKWLEPIPSSKGKRNAQRLCYVIQPPVP